MSRDDVVLLFLVLFGAVNMAVGYWIGGKRAIRDQHVALQRREAGRIAWRAFRMWLGVPSRRVELQQRNWDRAMHSIDAAGARQRPLDADFYNEALERVRVEVERAGLDVGPNTPYPPKGVEAEFGADGLPMPPRAAGGRFAKTKG